MGGAKRLWFLLLVFVGSLGVARAVEIIGMFPPSEYYDTDGVLHVDPEAWMVRAALELAVEDINENGTIVNGTLTLTEVDAGGLPVKAMSALCTALDEGEGAYGVVGPHLTAEADWIAATSNVWMHFPIVTYDAAGAHAGGNDSLYLFRATPGVEEQMVALATAILQEKEQRELHSGVVGDGHERVAVLSSNDVFGNAADQAFRDAITHVEFSSAQIDILASDQFELQADADHSFTINELLHAEANIIILLADHDSYPVVRGLLAQAKEAGLVSAYYQWYFNGALANDALFDVNATHHDSLLAYDMRGSLGVKPCYPSIGIGSTEAHTLEEHWLYQAQGELTVDQRMDPRVAYTYDAVWMLARAIGFAQAEAAEAGGELTPYAPEACGMVNGTWEHGHAMFHALHSVESVGATGALRVGAAASAGAHHFGAAANSRLLEDSTFCVSNLRVDAIKGSSFHTLSEWDRASEEGFVPVGQFPVGQTFPVDGAAYPLDRPTMHGKTFRVVVVSAPPFVMLTPTLDGWIEYHGISISFLQALALDIGFTVEIQAADESLDVDDVLQLVVDGEYDMSIAWWTITEPRLHNMSFSHPYWDLGLGFAAMIPEADHSLHVWSIFSPFTWQLWGTIILALLVTTFLFWLFEAGYNNDFCIHDGIDNVPQDMGLSFYATIALLLQQLTHKPETFEGYILTVGWMFVSLILAATYTGNVASFLTVRSARHASITLEDLETQVVLPSEVALAKGSIAEHFYQLDVLHCFHDCPVDFYHCDDLEDCLDAIEHREALVTIFDRPSLEYTTLVKHCDMEVLHDTIAPQNYGIALPKDSPYLDELEEATLRIRESGFTTELEHEFLNPSLNSCLDTDGVGEGAAAMAILDMGGIFIVMGMFAILSLGVWAFRKLHAANRHRKGQTRSQRKRALFDALVQDSKQEKEKPSKDSQPGPAEDSQQPPVPLGAAAAAFKFLSKKDVNAEGGSGKGKRGGYLGGDHDIAHGRPVVHLDRSHGAAAGHGGAGAGRGGGGGDAGREN